jgi:molybdopterin molybdotransferase
MISILTAKNIIAENAKPLAARQMKLQEAAGLILAADVYANMDIPAYPQSSMDGYAFSFIDWKTDQALSIEGEMAAGSDQVIELGKQKAIRIFTGAAVPPGADTVVMQEKVSAENGELIIQDEQITLGSNVRAAGSEIKKGELALSKNTYLSPAAIGFLAGIGVTDVQVIPRPRVTIIITGNELQKPGNPLLYGQVYDSNSFALIAALQEMKIHQVQVLQAPDDLNTLVAQLQLALEHSDVVLLTGGVSVGDYDFVVEASRLCGITTQFHKLKQRPGKPLFFGTKGDQLVFGLPGNPSSVLTCFYMYVVPALEMISRLGGNSQTLRVPMEYDYQKAAGLTHFLKGFYNGSTVEPLGAQASYRMRSFAAANCLIQIDEDVTDCKKGTMVTIHFLLPIYG